MLSRIVEILFEIEGPIYDRSVVLAGAEQKKRLIPKQEVPRIFGIDTKGVS
jgi:hypothetical protein